MQRLEVDDELLVEVIMAGARAGIFRTAARLNPSATIWRELAEEHSRRAGALLGEMMQRRGASDAAS